MKIVVDSVKTTNSTRKQFYQIPMYSQTHNNLCGWLIRVDVAVSAVSHLISSCSNIVVQFRIIKVVKELTTTCGGLMQILIQARTFAWLFYSNYHSSLADKLFENFNMAAIFSR